MAGTAKCLGFQQMTSLSSAIAPTIPTGTRFARIQAESQNVRYRLDGVDPATGVGAMILSGSYFPTEISVDEGLMAIKFIEAAASAKLNIHYFGTA